MVMFLSCGILTGKVKKSKCVYIIIKNYVLWMYNMKFIKYINTAFHNLLDCFCFNLLELQIIITQIPQVCT
jgi:hypothetical protein